MPTPQTPVATFQSGPVNSLRGAALLAGLPDAAVLDIGGTTTDVGLVVGGLPRPAPRAARFAGTDTNLQVGARPRLRGACAALGRPERLPALSGGPAAAASMLGGQAAGPRQMPDVFSVGLGGGSLVRFPGAAAIGASEAARGTAAEGATAAAPEACSVGPDSVGEELLERALLAGGPCCTASDVAVLLGRLELGSRQAVAAGGLTQEAAEAAWQAMQRQLEACLDRAKTQAGAHAQSLRAGRTGGWAACPLRGRALACSCLRPPARLPACLPPARDCPDACRCVDTGRRRCPGDCGGRRCAAVRRQPARRLARAAPAARGGGQRSGRCRGAGAGQRGCAGVAACALVVESAAAGDAPHRTLSR